MTLGHTKKKAHAFALHTWASASLLTRPSTVPAGAPAASLVSISICKFCTSKASRVSICTFVLVKHVNCVVCTPAASLAPPRVAVFLFFPCGAEADVTPATPTTRACASASAPRVVIFWSVFFFFARCIRQLGYSVAFRFFLFCAPPTC